MHPFRTERMEREYARSKFKALSILRRKTVPLVREVCSPRQRLRDFRNMRWAEWSKRLSRLEQARAKREELSVDKSRGPVAPAFFVTIHEWHGKGLTIVSHSRIRANVLRGSARLKVSYNH